MTECDTANDDVLSLDEASLLLDEIARLRGELASCEVRLAEAERLARRDALVDLSNRRGFFEDLERLIARVERHDVQASILFVDVDGLKAINDKFGHGAGDRALLDIARLLVSTARRTDVVARIAGDEFGILLEHAGELSASRMALRVVEAVDEYQFCVQGRRLPLSIAVGVAVVRPDDTPACVLDRADEEMYRFKRIPAARESAMLWAGSDLPDIRDDVKAEPAPLVTL